MDASRVVHGLSGLVVDPARSGDLGHRGLQSAHHRGPGEPRDVLHLADDLDGYGRSRGKLIQERLPRELVLGLQVSVSVLVRVGDVGVRADRNAPLEQHRRRPDVVRIVGARLHRTHDPVAVRGTVQVVRVHVQLRRDRADVEIASRREGRVGEVVAVDANHPGPVTVGKSRRVPCMSRYWKSIVPLGYRMISKVYGPPLVRRGTAAYSMMSLLPSWW